MYSFGGFVGTSDYPPIEWGRMPLPIFQSAVNECIQEHQVPALLAYSAALGALSVGLQYLNKVRKPAGGVGLVSLMLAVFAISGERKTTVEDDFLLAVRALETRLNAENKASVSSLGAELEIWKIRHSVLTKALQRKMTGGKEFSEESLALRAHLLLKPNSPKKMQFLYEDATVQSLMLGLRDCPSAGLLSSEGAKILEGSIFSEQAKVNTLWSGGTITINRVSADSFALEGRRLTTSVSIQIDKLKKYLQVKGESARASGILARMIMLDSGTTQGLRPIRNSVISGANRERFTGRLAELLEENLVAMDDPDFEPHVVEFSPAASTEWMRYFDYVELNIRPGGRYAGAGDHASKLADNVARVAAVMHQFEGFSGDISMATLNCAILVCDLASSHFVQYCVPKPEEFGQAEFLEAWLSQQYRCRGIRYVGKTVVRRYGPNSLRNTPMLNHAIDLLVSCGKLVVVKKNKTMYLDLFPHMSAS